MPGLQLEGKKKTPLFHCSSPPTLIIRAPPQPNLVYPDFNLPANSPNLHVERNVLTTYDTNKARRSEHRYRSAISLSPISTE